LPTKTLISDPGPVYVRSQLVGNRGSLARRPADQMFEHPARFCVVPNHPDE
jgi:hypothetical protein